ncbi:BgTH12-04106 [Blumeria graminis f. sp. triticale]|uniref:BgTH12-04106 n=1 Tax=Blumeria graminis f. sp. triticale TaxID=1689686 RepID=A0A9W4GCT1_BLUGR|nr:BgTH12-04106 [Blumeria graminis f. sp. triticale]
MRYLFGAIISAIFFTCVVARATPTSTSPGKFKEDAVVSAEDAVLSPFKYEGVFCGTTNKYLQHEIRETTREACTHLRLQVSRPRFFLGFFSEPPLQKFTDKKLFARMTMRPLFRFPMRSKMMRTSIRPSFLSPSRNDWVILDHQCRFMGVVHRTQPKVFTRCRSYSHVDAIPPGVQYVML